MIVVSEEMLEGSKGDQGFTVQQHRMAKRLCDCSPQGILGRIFDEEQWRLWSRMGEIGAPMKPKRVKNKKNKRKKNKGFNPYARKAGDQSWKLEPEPEMFLVRSRGGSKAHIWIDSQGDTACKMYSTGGLKQDGYETAFDKGNRDICGNCTREYGK